MAEELAKADHAIAVYRKHMCPTVLERVIRAPILAALFAENNDFVPPIDELARGKGTEQPSAIKNR